MTERDTYCAMLDRLGVEHLDVDNADLPHAVDVMVTSPGTCMPGPVSGYMGFYFVHTFDRATGELVQVSVWE